MKDECEATSNRIMTNSSELGGMFYNDLVEIYYRNLGDVFGTNIAGAQMLHARVTGDVMISNCQM